MATPQERLADSLRELQKLQNKNGLAVVKSGDISRTHLDRLVSNGYLQEVMKGWYISSRPDGLVFYYCLCQFAVRRRVVSVGGSIAVDIQRQQGCPATSDHSTGKRHSDVVGLLHNTSILCFQAAVANPVVTEPQFGLHLCSLPEALVECSPYFFRRDSIAARTPARLQRPTIPHGIVSYLPRT